MPEMWQGHGAEERKYGFFWSCSGYPDCKETLQDKNGKADMLSGTIDCPAYKHGKLRRIKGKYGYFWGCSNREGCNKIYPDVKGKPDLS